MVRLTNEISKQLPTKKRNVKQGFVVFSEYIAQDEK